MLRIDEAALRSLILLVFSLIHLTTRALRGARVAVHPRDKRAHGRSWRPDALLLLLLLLLRRSPRRWTRFFVFFAWEPAGWVDGSSLERQYKHLWLFYNTRIKGDWYQEQEQDQGPASRPPQPPCQGHDSTRHCLHWSILYEQLVDHTNKGKAFV